MALFWLAVAILDRRHRPAGDWRAPVVLACLTPVAIDIVALYTFIGLSSTKAGHGVGPASALAMIALAGGGIVVLLSIVGIAANIWAVVWYPLNGTPSPSDGPDAATPSEGDTSGNE